MQQGVFGGVDSGRHIRGQERDLLGLGEEILGIPVQDEATHDIDWDQFLRDEFRCVEDVEGELLRLRLGENLDAELPFGEVALRD